jgi:hypothetical protein
MDKDFKVEVKLKVEQNEAVIAHLTFRNNSERSIYLNTQVSYYDGRVRNDYFEVHNSKWEEISYLGVMANCTRLPDEYILLQPGEEISSAISLKEWYRLTKGDTYNIRYYAFNPSFKGESWGLMEMKSNEVKISYE